MKLEVNLQISKLRLKVQPSIPTEVREQQVSTIQTGLEEIGWVVPDCIDTLDQAL